MALKGIKVLEFAGLAPAPFCGMVLANLGASVTIIEKMTPNVVDVLSNGKRSIAIDLKTPRGVEIIKKLVCQSDVLIEPYRPGIMERLGLGPDILMKENPRLIYARLTGYGQTGELSRDAGHDINYVAMSGILSCLGRKDSKPFPPVNLLADFAGGGLMCAFGIVAALFERSNSGAGQVLDVSMVEGVAYLATWFFSIARSSLWTGVRGANILDSGFARYDTYKTNDGKYMSVGAIEPQFYSCFIKILGLSEEEIKNFSQEELKSTFSDIFSKRSQEYWSAAFKGTDACVAPVLSIEDAFKNPHNVARNTFTLDHDKNITANPAPKFSRTPSLSTLDKPCPKLGQHTKEILQELKYTSEEISQLQEKNIAIIHPTSQL